MTTRTFAAALALFAAACARAEGFDFDDMTPEDLTVYDKANDKPSAADYRVKVSKQNFQGVFLDQVMKRRERILRIVARLHENPVSTFTPIELLCREIEANRLFTGEENFEFVGANQKEIELVRSQYRALEAYCAVYGADYYIVAALRSLQESGFSRDINQLDRVRVFLDDMKMEKVLRQLETIADECYPRMRRGARNDVGAVNAGSIRTFKHVFGMFLDFYPTREYFTPTSSGIRLETDKDNDFRAIDLWMAEVSEPKLERMEVHAKKVETCAKNLNKALLEGGDAASREPGSRVLVPLFEIDVKIKDAFLVLVADQAVRIGLFRADGDYGCYTHLDKGAPKFSRLTAAAAESGVPSYQARARQAAAEFTKLAQTTLATAETWRKTMDAVKK